MANRRETAHRIFAGELSRAVQTRTEDREFSPTYAISEAGSKISRVLIGGVLLDKENMGSEGDPFYRARVEDPTGLFYLRAGQYNPEGAKALAKLEPPCHVLAVGKVRTYSPEPDQVYVSVQPEIIKEVPESHYQQWVMETSRYLRTRLEGLKELQQLEEPTEEKLGQLGFSPRVAEGLALSHEFYGDNVSVESYVGLLYDSMTKILPEGTDMPERPSAAMPPPRSVVHSDPAESTALAVDGPRSDASRAASLAVEQASDSAVNFTTGKEMLRSKPNHSARPDEVPGSALAQTDTTLPAAPTDVTGNEALANDAGEIDREAVVTALIGHLDQDTEGALWEILAEAAQKKGIDSVELDETLNTLRDQGLIYEPTFGRFKLS